MSAYSAELAELSKTGNSEQDLKISFATSEDLGHSKTWRMKSLWDEEENAVESENEPIFSQSLQHVWLEQPIPDKLFFLATGEGCATVEVNLHAKQ